MLNDNNKYLSRGKKESDGKWVIGYYMRLPSVGLPDDTSLTSTTIQVNHFIVTESGKQFSVDPATVGRCMAIKDKDGQLIFEDDILMGEATMANMVYYNGRCTTKTWKNKLTYVAELTPSKLQLLSVEALSCSVVGNIHDDPKLVDSNARRLP